MSTDFEEPPVQTAASLVSGILSDLQTLVQQQFLLTRRELEAELRLRATAAAVFAAGMAVFFLDAIILCLALAHLIHWLASARGIDVAWLPLWACHAIVAGALFVIGGLLAITGRARLNSMGPFANSASPTLEEQPQWKTPPI